MECAHCGIGADEQEMHGESCIVCLAEQFGIDSTEERIAGLVRSFVLAAAGDRRAFVRLFQEAAWALSEIADARTTAS